MFGVAPHELTAKRGVVRRPEVGEIGRDLDRAVVGRQEVQDHRDSIFEHAWALHHPEEVLESRRDVWRSARFKLELEASATR